MTADEVAALKPGDRIRWQYHAPQTISHRKDDDSGWWLTDGSGVNDTLALTSDDWRLA